MPRVAIIPLWELNKEYSLPGEIMMNPDNGHIYIKKIDGSVVISKTVELEELLKTKLDGEDGHTHTGIDGDAPKIDPTTGLTYVPVNKIGDTMTGKLIIDFADGLTIKPGVSDYSKLNFNARTSQSNTTSGMIGYLNAASKDLEIKNNLSTGNIILSPTNEARVGTHRILTVNDVGAGKGLNSDLLDGKHASDFATSDHDHPHVRLDGTLAMTGNLILSGDPVNDNHAANKRYVDLAAQGFLPKDPARVATTSNITLSGLQTVDGVSLIAGDRVIVKNQTNKTQNGIYTVSSTAWSRSEDADNANTEIRSGLYVYCLEGTTYQGCTFAMTASDINVTLGTTELEFRQISSPVSLSASGALEKTNNEVRIKSKGVTTEYLANGSVNDTILGTRTISPAALGANTANITTILNGIAYQLSNITGNADWKTSPIISLNNLNTHSHDGTANNGNKLDPTSALTYVPLNKAGDTMTGTLTLNSTVNSSVITKTSKRVILTSTDAITFGNVSVNLNLESLSLPVVKIGANSFNVALMKKENGYFGIEPSDGTSWIRTPSSGLIPFDTNGTSNLGSSGWNFNKLYVNDVIENGTSIDSKYLKRSGGTITGSLGFSRNGVTSSISSDNGSFLHFRTSASNGFYFDNALRIDGEIYAGAGTYNKKVWHEGNHGSGSGLDADKLDGYHINKSGAYFSGIPYIASDGVMEVGRYIDFHTSNADTSDYTARIESPGSSSLIMNTKAASGVHFRFINSNIGGLTSTSEPCLAPTRSSAGTKGWGSIGIDTDPIFKVYTYQIVYKSDREEKTDIVNFDIEEGYNYFNQLKFYTYKYLDMNNEAHWKDQLGVMAQDVPYLVSDYNGEKEDTNMIDSYALISLIGSSVKFIDKKVIDLSNRVVELENKLDSMSDYDNIKNDYNSMKNRMENISKEHDELNGRYEELISRLNSLESKL